MNDNEMSLEALYSEALGISSNNKPVFSQSNEDFDGFYDALEADIAKGFESLNFIDTYTALEQKNAAEMIRMCKKLSVNYGLKSGVNEKAATSIESLCRIRSMEADAAAVDAGAAPKVADGNKPKEDGKKKENIFKRIWESIKTIFINIGKFFKKIWGWIQDKIINRFKKADRNATPEELKAVETKVEAQAAQGGEKKEEFWVITNGSVNTNGFKGFVKTLRSIQKKVVSTTGKIEGNKKANVEAVNQLLQQAIGNEGQGIKAFFNVGMSIKNDRSMKMALQWAGNAQNINAGQAAVKGIDPVIKELENLSNECGKLADTYASTPGDYSTDEGKKAYDAKMQAAGDLRAIAKACNTARTSMMRFVKAFSFSNKLYNDATTGKKAQRKALIEKAEDDAANKKMVDRMKAKNTARTSESYANV